MASTGLSAKLKQVRAVFDLNKVLAIQSDDQYVQRYYQKNKLAYSLLHTRSDKIYMGISRDGIYKEDDLLEAARTVQSYITPPKTRHILELASGRGATSAYLAEKYPAVKFLGIELSPGQFGFARKKARVITNYQPSLGNYHDLSRYATGSIDIVFVIEALCYSHDKAVVIAEVKRVLKKGGVFIILDGYTAQSRARMTEEELLAVRLTEKGMAVDEFADYPSLLRAAKKLGFDLESSEDVSQFIMPTLRRFESLAGHYFRRPWRAKTISWVFSPELTYNAISGLLMPDLIERCLASYYITVLKK
jgi:SAM-dependent methyltransferase